MFVFALAVVFVFLVLAAQYESWTLPLAVILVVPMCLLLLAGRRQLGGHGGEHLHADRLRGAGRSGQQERDPDRRVRQAAAGSRAWTAARRRLRGMPLRLRPILMTSFAFIFGVAAAGVRHRRRRRNAPLAGPGRVQRHAGRDVLRHLPDAGLFLLHPTRLPSPESPPRMTWTVRVDSNTDQTYSNGRANVCCAKTPDKFVLESICDRAFAGANWRQDYSRVGKVMTTGESTNSAACHCPGRGVNLGKPEPRLT